MAYRLQAFKTEVYVQLDKYRNDNITFVVQNDYGFKWLPVFLERFGLKDINVKIITVEQFLKGELDSMQFDYIVGNPPYQGGKQLHQQIFNKSVQLLKLGGAINFIQPAYPYQNNKNTNFVHNQKMVENIKRYKTSVKIVSGSIFKEAAIMTDLGITTLTKELSSAELINEVEYKNGEIYKNVDINDICFNQTPPDIFRSIKQKYLNIIQQNGSLLDLVLKDQKDNANCICIAQIRGNIDMLNGGVQNDFFTFFSPNDRVRKKDISFSLRSKAQEKENMYDYLESNVARYGLSILKISPNSHRGELKFVPIIDFSKKYSNEELYDIFNLTDEEIMHINLVIKD